MCENNRDWEMMPEGSEHFTSVMYLNSQNLLSHSRKRRLRDNLTWLEEQQATINQQVKLGGKLVKGGGSSLTKRARVGRGY